MIGTVSRAVSAGGIGWLLCTAVVVSAGCATSEDLVGVRQEIQDIRVKYEHALSQSEGKRKAAEELQGHLLKAFEAQAHTLAGLTSKVQDLQARQEHLQNERIATQGINAALRDTILRALKSEQADLQQRLINITDYINDVEQANSGGAVTAPMSSPPATDRLDKGRSDGQTRKNLDGSKTPQ